MLSTKAELVPRSGAHKQVATNRRRRSEQASSRHNEPNLPTKPKTIKDQNPRHQSSKESSQTRSSREKETSKILKKFSRRGRIQTAISANSIAYGSYYAPIDSTYNMYIHPKQARRDAFPSSHLVYDTAVVSRCLSIFKRHRN